MFLFLWEKQILSLFVTHKMTGHTLVTLATWRYYADLSYEKNSISVNEILMVLQPVNTDGMVSN